MAEMMELSVKDFIIATINMHNIFKDLTINTNIRRKEMKDIKENQMEFTGLKNSVFEMNSSLVGD